jgi:probable HAF family extracellular repeat protein
VEDQLDVNESGVIVGIAGYTAPEPDRAVLWTKDGTIRYLETPAGMESQASAVNNLGQAAGSTTAPQSPSEAALWLTDGSLVPLGSLSGGSFSNAFDLNDAGQVVGIAGAGGYFGFVWDEASGMQPLPRLDSSFTSAEAINNLGQIVGYSGSSAVLWDDGEIVALPTLEGGSSAAARDINDAGQIVGESTDAADVWHAVMWEREEPNGSASAAEYQYGGGWQVVDLGSLGGSWTGAQGINEYGLLVVGAMQEAPGGLTHGFVWENGEFTLLPSLPGDNTTYASSVNDAGQIVGSSASAGPPFVSHAVLWTRGTDTTPPEITVPDDMTVDATSPDGAVVEFTVTAWDEVDGDVPVTCEPSSGSTFPIGNTTVTCDATDAAGNSASASFLVTVKGASEQLADLRQAAEGVGSGTSLADKVEAAQAALAEGDDAGTCEILNAFIKQVEAQSGKKIEAATAADLIADAARIRAVLGC